MAIMDFLRRLFKKSKPLGPDMPIWAYGLECGVCKMSFVSPQSHMAQVSQNKSLDTHKDKIPILKGGD